MGASFLASTAMIVSMGLLSMLLTADKLPAAVHPLNFLGEVDERTFAIKLLLLIANFLFVFFNFALAIRYYNHVSLDIKASPEAEFAETAILVKRLFNRGAGHYTLGMRGYYLAVPVTLWIFGPLWMFLGSIGLVVILYRLDHIT